MGIARYQRSLSSGAAVSCRHPRRGEGLEDEHTFTLYDRANISLQRDPHELATRHSSDSTRGQLIFLCDTFTIHDAPGCRKLDGRDVQTRWKPGSVHRTGAENAKIIQYGSKTRYPERSILCRVEKQYCEPGVRLTSISYIFSLRSCRLVSSGDLATSAMTPEILHKGGRHRYLRSFPGVPNPGSSLPQITFLGHYYILYTFVQL